jgi:type IV secretory pathway VirB10-like protein
MRPGALQVCTELHQVLPFLLTQRQRPFRIRDLTLDPVHRLQRLVDNHWGALFKAALLSTLLGVGSELGSTTGTGSNSDVISALRRGSSDSLNQTGQKVVQQNLNIQPTLTVRPGFPVRVIVNRDLVLEPYSG